jgi:molybdate transport system substrate-binding protein
MRNRSVKHGFKNVLVVLLVLSIFPGARVHAKEIIVSAAASLTDAFADIEPAFETMRPDVDVVLNFASSGALYRQIEQGAPVDVFASANPKWMEKAVASGLVAPESVCVFAQNELVLAAPAENPARIEHLKDLGMDRVKSIGIGTPATVPAGQYAQGALVKAGLYSSLQPKLIFSESVRQVLDYLVRGEVDCGFVYATDAVKAGEDVIIIQKVPLDTLVTYPMAPLEECAHPDLAAAFIEFVTSEKGMAILEGRGFKRP